MVSTRNGKYEYPSEEDSWSVGKMRKRGEQYAMMRRKGEAGTEGLLTEMDRAAGFGLTSRGGPSARAEVTRGAGGLSPDVIAQQKSAIQGFGNQWQLGTINWRKLHQKTNKSGWSLVDPSEYLDAIDPTGELAKHQREMMDKQFQKFADREEQLQENVTKGGTKGWVSDKLLEMLKERGMIKVKDPNGKEHEIPLGENTEE